MQFLAMLTEDFLEEVGDLTPFAFRASTWSIAIAIAEAQAEKVGMELDSLVRES